MVLKGKEPGFPIMACFISPKDMLFRLKWQAANRENKSSTLNEPPTSTAKLNSGLSMCNLEEYAFTTTSVLLLWVYLMLRAVIEYLSPFLHITLKICR